MRSTNGDISNDLDEPGFQCHGISEVEYLKNCAFWDKVTKNTSRISENGVS